MSQLTLLPVKPVKQSKPTLSIEPVPVSIALGDRYFLTVKQGDRTWTFPLQLTEVEAHWLLSHVGRLDWSLSSTGVPANLPRIHSIIERAINGRMVGGGK